MFCELSINCVNINKMCICSNKSCVRSFAGCADLNLAGLCWVSWHKFSDAVMTIFSGQSVISRVYTSCFGNVRIAWNLDRSGTKKVPGTRYSTQWKTPQKWTVLNRTMQWKSAIRNPDGSWVLLIRAVTDVKKLFLWREVLVLMDRSLLPDGSASESLCPGWEMSATILTGRFRVLEMYRSWRDGSLHPITFSAEQITHFSV